MKVKINRDILFGYAIVLLLMVGWFIFFSQTNTAQYDNLYAKINKVMTLEAKIRELQISNFGSLMNAHNTFSENQNVENLQELSQQVRNINGLFGLQYARLAEINRQRAEAVQQHILAYYKPLQELEKLQTDASVRSWINRNQDFFKNQNNGLNLLRVDLETIRSLLTQDIIIEANEIPKIVSANFQTFFLIFAVMILLGMVFGILFSRRISKVIDSVSEELNTASEDILTAANNEEQSFTTQSESIDKTASTLEELSRFSHEVANNAQNVTEQFEKTASQMSELKQKAQQIGQITTTIEEMTHQINILSLNASIEASRAGEQGKGFSAVALEIRKLAENTRGFTENITNLIREIQNYTVTSVDLTENAVNHVKNITTNVRKQNTATADISETFSSINKMMKESVDNIRGTVEASENVLGLAKQLKAMT